MEISRNIKKSRRWCWQDKDMTEFIRNNFKGQKLTTALAIYQTLTELASNNSSDEFTAYYSQIAKLTGKSISTVKIYCRRFVELRILDKKNRKVDGKTNLSNEWSLLTPSVSNNYQTSVKDDYPTSDKNGYQLLEENELEKDNKNEVKNLSETESYKKLKEKAEGFRRSPYA